MVVHDTVGENVRWKLVLVDDFFWNESLCELKLCLKLLPIIRLSIWLNEANVGAQFNKHTHCREGNAKRAETTLLAIFVLPSPQKCLGMDFTRSAKSFWDLVTATGFSHEFVLVPSSVFDSFFVTGELPKVMKEFLVDSTVTRGAGMLQKNKIGLAHNVLIDFLLQKRIHMVM